MGRDAMLSAFGNKQLYSEDQSIGNEDSTHLQLHAMIHARAVIVRGDSERLIWLGLRRPVRAGSKTDFKVADAAKLYTMRPRIREMRWQCAFRAIGILTHHLAVERKSGV